MVEGEIYIDILFAKPSQQSLPEKPFERPQINRDTSLNNRRKMRRIPSDGRNIGKR